LCTGGSPFCLWYAIAYAMSDYDYDHFEMIGPDVARRIGRLATWVTDVFCTPGGERLLHR
jgi:hypothetical protein